MRFVSKLFMRIKFKMSKKRLCIFFILMSFYKLHDMMLVNSKYLKLFYFFKVFFLNAIVFFSPFSKNICMYIYISMYNIVNNKFTCNSGQVFCNLNSSIVCKSNSNYINWLLMSLNYALAIPENVCHLK